MAEESMSVPFKALTQSQRYWYAEMIIAAILADGEISQPETEYIKGIIRLVKKPDEKQDLVARLASKRPPPITRPAGVPPKVLAAVYLELVLVLISDAELTDAEKQFLEETARVFRFSDTYRNDLMQWALEGLSWKSGQADLVAAEKKSGDTGVPLASLNNNQLHWYAEVLVATIMSDQQLDASEVRFLKMAIDLVKEESHRQKLTELVRSNTAPQLKPHPGLDENTLKRIFLEVLLIISADESLQEDEMRYLRQLADLCGFSEELYRQMIDWCLQGIQWKKAKDRLIDNCQIAQESDDLQVFSVRENREADAPRDGNPEPAEVAPRDGNPEPAATPAAVEDTVQPAEPPSQPVPASQPNLESNAITDFNLACFVCGSQEIVKHFALKPKSLKASHNIFGIPVYQVSADGFDFIDYNQCKVTICPSCFFASTQKQMFRQKADAPLPKVLQHPEFRESWLKGRESRQKAFRDFLPEIASVHRSQPLVLKSYETAINAATTLAQLNNSFELVWHTITLRLTLAEVLMGQGKQEEAEQLLRDIQKKAAELFKTVKNRFITFRSGRLVMLTAVFFGNEKIANHYFEYFQKLRSEQFDQMKGEDQELFKLVFGEMKQAHQNKAAYFRENMNGFRLSRKVSSPGGGKRPTNAESL